MLKQKKMEKINEKASLSWNEVLKKEQKAFSI